MSRGRDSRCSSCRKRIRWVRLPSGAWMPLDPAAADDGNVLVDGGRGVVMTGRDTLARLRAEGVPLYLPHFATCPRRRSKKGRRKQKGAAPA